MNAVNKFQDITGCKNESAACTYLENNHMNLNAAIDQYFADQYREINDTALNQISSNDIKLLNEIFDHYCERRNPEEMDVDGTIQYFTDLGINPEEDVTAIIAAYILESPSQGVFLRSCFVNNWSKINMKVDTLEGMKEYLVKSKQDNDLMKQVYKFAFRYALEDGEKKLELDAAVALWKVFYCDQFNNYNRTGQHSTVTKFVEDYLLGGVLPEKKKISRDEWDMALLFFQISLDKLENHSSAAAWPLLMDDFVDFLFGRL